MSQQDSLAGASCPIPDMEVQCHRCLVLGCQIWNSFTLECLEGILNLRCFFEVLVFLLRGCAQIRLDIYVSLASIGKPGAQHLVGSTCSLCRQYEKREPNLQFYQIA